MCKVITIVILFMVFKESGTQRSCLGDSDLQCLTLFGCGFQLYQGLIRLDVQGGSITLAALGWKLCSSCQSQQGGMTSLLSSVSP